MNFEDRQIRRIIFQVKYKHCGKFLDNQGLLLDILGEWWKNRSFKFDRIQLKDDARFLDALITWNVSQLDSEYIPNFGFYLDMAKTRLPEKLWQVMGIEEFEWMGCRTIMVFPQEEPFSQLVQELMSFYGISQECWDIVGGCPSDLGFPFVFESSSRRINLSFGPMERKQMEDQYFTVHSNLPDRALFIDCDYIQLGSYPSNKIRTFLKEATEFADVNACEFVRQVVTSKGGCN